MRQAVVASLLFSPALLANGAGFEGRWEGLIQIPGHEARVVVDLAPKANAWVGSIILPGLGIKGAPLSNLVAAESDVAFDLGNLLRVQDQGPARFRLRLDGDRLTGELSQGGNVAPVSLRRTGVPQVDTASTSTPVARSLEGEWRGEFELGGYPRQVTIRLENHPDAAATASFLVVGKQVNNLPVDRVVEEGRLVRIESQTTRVAFEGRLIEESDELRGTIEVGAFEQPLALHRSSRRAS